MVQSTPYSSQPDRAFWRRAVSAPDWEAVDPVSGFPLKITRETKIATAGSCFAQHIARHLASAGFNYYVTEPGHPMLPEHIRRKYNYGLFSARYGNIYTAAQLNQLLQRAFGDFFSVEKDWQLESGRWIDPFRPNVNENGFSSSKELLHDREQHLAAVRDLFRNTEVFIFTLGLTEAWRSRKDGTVFPLCPGVKGGIFNEAQYEFVNYEFGEIVDQMEAFIKRVRSVSHADCRFILTVSPVPLMATATDQHVLVATTLSKSILRAAADHLQRKLEGVYYFPSYEIITGAHTRGRYFGKDLRDVEDLGVQRVMNLFFKHVAGKEDYGIEGGAREPLELNDSHVETGMKLMTVLCDEELLDVASATEI